MPVVTLKTGVGIVPALTAGASVNVMAGQQYEFCPFHANVRIAAVTTAAGVLMTVYDGTDLVQQEGPVVGNFAADQFPKYPDDFHIQDDMAAGDRINITLRNTTAGTLVAIVVVHIDPL
jgi:hypothetical protein